jgi:hypothetical protein
MNTKPKAYSYIRFSTPEQEKGDSLRRQEKQAEEYAIKHGLALDENQKFKDLGKSGYKGFNRIDGALKDFLDLIEKKEIPYGSVLIVEHLDRLSREKITEAFTLFINLLKKGIRIVTLQDNMEYDKKSIDEYPYQLTSSIALMAAAHNESVKKSKRVKEARQEKRRRLQNQEIRIFTAQCPSWLMLSEDKTKFISIPEACIAINMIFQKRLEGKGSYRISKELNSDSAVWTPPLNRRKKTGGWRESYINKILRSKSVIGELQLYEIKTETIVNNGNEQEITKRVAVGEPLTNYYPKVIDEGVFFRVQEIIKVNGELSGHGGGGGKKDKCSNLFSYVVKCGICGSTMQYLNKGSINRQYLVCDSVRRKNKVLIPIKKDHEHVEDIIAAKLNKREISELEVQTVEAVCDAKTVRYDEFERIFFENFEELDMGKLIPNDNETTKHKKVSENKISENNYKLKELENQIDNLLETISITDDEENKRVYDGKVTEKRLAKEKLQTENQQLEQEMENLADQRKKLVKQKDIINEVYSFLKSAKDEQERIDRRFLLRQEIKNMIEWIRIYTLQEKYAAYEEIEPGIIRHMGSKTIDRIRIKFRGSKILRVIFLKSNIDVLGV